MHDVAPRGLSHDLLSSSLAVIFVISLSSPTCSCIDLLQHNPFEQMPLKLATINTGYQLARFVAITVVLGLF